MAYLIYEHGERASSLAITSNYEIYYEHSVLVTKVQTTTKNNFELMVGAGVFNDKTGNPEFTYDGGDCC